jgi:hypothetical protein
MRLGQGLRYVINWGIRPNFLTKTPMSTNKFFYHGFWKTPLKTHSGTLTRLSLWQVFKVCRALTNNL